MTLSSSTDESLEDLALTPDPVDEAFAQPYVDVDEWRETPAHHRYIHGGFADSDTRFSLYLPTQDQFEGRFFQHVTPVPQSENLAQQQLTDENPVPFTLASGGYYIETNGGGPGAANPMSGIDPTIGAYRANAAVARLSRQIAEWIYGPQRVYGYLYGGSGGGYRTIGASENTDGVWDGYVPYVIGSPMAIPNVFAVRMHAQRLLRHAFPRIVDAFDAGGDPTTLKLSTEEQAALDEVTRMGFPVRSWFGWQTMGMHAFSVLYPGIMHADPAYAEDFWSAEGYLGSDLDSSVHRDRVQLKTTLVELLTADSETAAITGGVDESYKATARPRTVIGARIADRPEGFTLGAELAILTGPSAGKLLRLTGVDGTTVLFEPGEGSFELTPGDEVLVDNSNFLAAQTYHRHQVPSSDYIVWDQFRTAAGSPAPPQRPVLLGPLFAAAASGTVPTGRISGHMIVVASLLDREAFPWQADWYRSRVGEFIGDNVDDRFRLWYTDNALHGDESGIQEHETRTVSYVGALQAALRQLSAWVEQGTAPAPSTTYAVHEGQVLVDANDAARGGVQPIVALTVDGSDRAEVSVGAIVTVRITAHATTRAGIITDVVTDLHGTGHFDTTQQVTPAGSVEISEACSFEFPGTYLIAVRATAQVGGNADDRFARVDNIARARIVVRAIDAT
ncbi:hypothetical protein HQQ88_19000 [Curtobacterium sp. VKM Ac-2861]|uniref:alpha/beta hydrolase domain-containing protein n=1 Tax=unclassified Curtobacterium TaxID=257496 RepID=UPI000F467316|nr:MULTISPECIES: alpha/beta hydrolase domain-containing protein [unclassified Curtobacterium]NQW92386.1 hypothetical protein [Curtobacterium sp. VKM Ac-2861]ROQ17476.1 hypothetical protein EDF41_0510 [Curtobacterium sp. PhB171]ROQ29279.1 hypothetical protein EDF40_0514 [Curtobacterium sp. PhB170]ROS45577.1 hypothetical protein EDF25_0335 [Curtobacterium sp. PhB131]ROS68121.1 hypothetical protein EDF30_2460 [Curtobacterium sp. PhB141]